MSNADDRADQRLASTLLVRTLAHSQNRAPPQDVLEDHQEISGCSGAGTSQAPAYTHFDVGGELARMAVRAQIVGPRYDYLADCGQNRLAT